MLNQDIIRTFVENYYYKYLGILKTDTIKELEIKKKKKEPQMNEKTYLQPKFHQIDKHLD